MYSRVAEVQQSRRGAVESQRCGNVLEVRKVAEGRQSRKSREPSWFPGPAPQLSQAGVKHLANELGR